ncbi:ABC transporter substrate-binding protein [Streptomyces sp. NPDC005955]|uniref:ABC transporter substrate-binding protein n=1 Tax=Streptomyces sp. NPDC005955 TaxID=3364738 RepID=UPI003689CCDD
MRTPRTRTSRLIGAVIAGLVLVTGCAAPDDRGADRTPGSSGAAATDLPAAEGATAYPLTLKTPFGDTTLDRRPERIAIVTANTLDTDALIALGGTPVFAPSTVDRNPWLDDDAVTGIAKLWDAEAGTEVSAESVAAASPDLIVALAAYETFDQARFDKLSAIAPVLYAPQGELTWQELTRKLGDTLDLSDAAVKAVETAERSVAKTRAEHPEFRGKSATHIIVYDEKYGPYYASSPGSDTARLFEQLGFVLPGAAAKFTKDGTISDELVGLIDADFLLLSTSADPAYFVDAPLVKAVPAVADGRAVINPQDKEAGTNHFAWGLNVQSVLSVPWLIEQLAEFGGKAIR